MPRIVYADDNADIVKIVRFLVSNMRGMQIETCRDGEEAIAAIEQAAPELVILDANMPRADGLTVLRWLRSRPESARVPVIFLTADSRRETLEACLNAGAQAVLTKPFNPSQLVAQIRSSLASGPDAPSPEKTQP